MIVKLYLTEEEKKMLEENCARAGISTLSAYARKMIFDGYILHVDCSAFQEIVKLMRSISNNINQIARRVNLNGSAYAEDMNEIQTRQAQLWEKVNDLLLKFGSVVSNKRWQ